MNFNRVLVWTVMVGVLGAGGIGTTAQATLISHFMFDDSGNLGDDTGTFNNDATGSIGTPSFTTAAKVGAGAVDLDGGDALIIPNAGSYTTLDDNGDGFTVAAWVNRGSGGQDTQRVFSRAMGGGFVPDSWGVGVRDDQNGLVATTYGVVDYNLSNQPVPRDGWHHLAYVYGFNGTAVIDVVDFYIDGFHVGTVDPGPAGMNNASDGSFTIGNLNLPTSRQFFVGLIDDLRVYNTELPAGQIAELAGIPEPTTLLIWSLLAGLGVGLGWRRRK